MKNLQNYTKWLLIISILLLYSLFVYVLSLTSVRKVHADDYDKSYDRYEEGYNDGYQDGCDDGYNNGYDSGYTSGFDDGYEDGHDDAYDDGYDKGYDKGLKALLDSNSNYKYTQYDVDEAYREGYDTGWDDHKVDKVVEVEEQYTENYVEVPVYSAETAETILNDSSNTDKLVISATELYNYSFEKAYRCADDPMKFIITGGQSWKIYKIQ